jgi:hypothetical protein
MNPIMLQFLSYYSKEGKYFDMHDEFRNAKAENPKTFRFAFSFT